MSEAAKIKEFIVEEFMPDVSTEELEADYDLAEGGAIDSLGLLKLVAWLETEYGVEIDEAELGPDSLRTVNQIDAYIAENRD